MIFRSLGKNHSTLQRHRFDGFLDDAVECGDPLLASISAKLLGTGRTCWYGGCVTSWRFDWERGLCECWSRCYERCASEQDCFWQSCEVSSGGGGLMYCSRRRIRATPDGLRRSATKVSGRARALRFGNFRCTGPLVDV